MDASVWTKIIMAICAFGTIAYTILKDKLSNKKDDLKNTRSILRRREDIRDSKKYLQDLEINKITYLKGFKWSEVEVLLEKDISLSTISNIQALKKESLLIIRNNEIIIPSKSYILKSKICKLQSFVILGNFVFSVLLIGWLISHYSLNTVEYASSLIYMLISEVIAIYHFDSLISFDLIKDSGDMSENDIFISQDFDRELQR